MSSVHAMRQVLAAPFGTVDESARDYARVFLRRRQEHGDKVRARIRANCFEAVHDPVGLRDRAARYAEQLREMAEAIPQMPGCQSVGEDPAFELVMSSLHHLEDEFKTMNNACREPST